MNEVSDLMNVRSIKAWRAARAFALSPSTVYRRLRTPSPPAGRKEPSKTKNVDDDEEVRQMIQQIKTAHPAWGQRRVRAWLRKKKQLAIGRKRTLRLMRETRTLCPRKVAKPRRNHLDQPLATAPRTHWQIDMTSFVLENLQTVFLVVIIDVFSRKIVGSCLSLRCRAKEWIQALDHAVLAEFPDGVRERHLVLRADNGSQPTSRAFVDHLKTLGIRGEWTGYNSPESNAYVERVIRTLKEEVIWPNLFASLTEAQQAINNAIDEYNADYPHSSLGYLSPNEFEQAWKNGLVSFEPFRDQKGRKKLRIRLSKKAA